MFDSGIKASELISQIKEEADVALPISEENYVQWLNALEQLLYTEVIKEQNKYSISRYSPLLVNKLNLWPLFDDQTNGDVALTMTEQGVYKLKGTRAVSSTTNTGALFEKIGVLPAGTYTLSDNANPFSGNMPEGLNRTVICDASSGAVLANISVMGTTNSSKTFTLTKDTEVSFRLTVQQYVDLGSSGYLTRPQLEAGDKKTAFIPPLALDARVDFLSDFPTAEGEEKVRFEDVHAVFADNTQLIKSTLTSGVIFPNAYFKDGNRFNVNLTESPSEITVMYYAKPELKTVDDFANKNVMVPIEFIELVKSKLRGEAYKLVNEGELAAVWLNDYNILLETFKAWVSQKQSTFGM